MHLTRYYSMSVFTCFNHATRSTHAKSRTQTHTHTHTHTHTAVRFNLFSAGVCSGCCISPTRNERNGGVKMQQIESIRCCCTALLAAPQTTLLYECTFAVFCLDYARVILASSNFRRTEASRDAGRAQTIRYCEDKSTVTRHREQIYVHY